MCALHMGHFVEFDHILSGNTHTEVDSTMLYALYIVYTHMYVCMYAYVYFSDFSSYAYVDHESQIPIHMCMYACTVHIT